MTYEACHYLVFSTPVLLSLLYFQMVCSAVCSQTLLACVLLLGYVYLFVYLFV